MATDYASYAVALKGHEWCLDRGIITRIRFDGTKWLGEYALPQTGWTPFPPLS